MLAEAVGFEPTEPVRVQLISNQSRYDHFDTLPYLSPNIRSQRSLGKRRELMERTKGIQLSRRLGKASHINGLRFLASRYQLRFRVRRVTASSLLLHLVKDVEPLHVGIITKDNRQVNC